MTEKLTATEMLERGELLTTEHWNQYLKERASREKEGVSELEKLERNTKKDYDFADSFSQALLFRKQELSKLEISAREIYVQIISTRPSVEKALAAGLAYVQAKRKIREELEALQGLQNAINYSIIDPINLERQSLAAKIQNNHGLTQAQLQSMQIANEHDYARRNPGHIGQMQERIREKGFERWQS